VPVRLSGFVLDDGASPAAAEVDTAREQGAMAAALASSFDAARTATHAAARYVVSELHGLCLGRFPCWPPRKMHCEPPLRSPAASAVAPVR
jgi:hypothetical protein